MNRDFFDDLTDPATGERGMGSLNPPDERSARLMRELRPALELLHAGAPDNGIDLVPLWARLIEDAEADAGEEVSAARAARASSATIAGKTDRFPKWLGSAFRYAAVLLVGLGLGVVTGGAENFNGEATDFRADADVSQCQYTVEQGTTMVSLLQAPVGGPMEPLQLAAADLAGCIGCHDGLGRKLRGVLDLP